MGIKRKKTIGDFVILLILILAAVMCLIPIFNTIAISLSDKASANAGRVFIWPVNFTIAPYQKLLDDLQFFRSFGISVERVLIGTSINIVLIILTAYPLSKSPKNFRMRNVYMWFIVFLMLFNGGMVPNYILVSKLGLQNTVWAMVLTDAVPIFSVIILMNYYKTVPVSLEEAALVDGAGPWYIMFKIYVPLSKPSIAVTALWAIVGHWNDFYKGLVYNNSSVHYPLQTYIQSLNVTVTTQDMANLKGEELAKLMALSNLTFTSAKVVISMIPILLVYPFLQRYFVTGIVMGAVKE